VSLLPRPSGSGRGLILRRWPAGETSAVVSALIDGFGLVRLLGKGARLARSRLRPLVEPGRLVDLEFSLYSDRDLQYLRGGGLVLDPLAGSPTLEKTAYLLSTLELVDRCRPGDGHEAGLFALCQAFVQALSCAGAGSEAGLFYAFEIGLLELLGLRPQMEACVRCGTGEPAMGDRTHWLHPAAGGLVCGACAARGQVVGALPLTAEHRRVWSGMAAAPDRWPEAGMPRRMTRDWGVMLHRFLAYHLPGYRLPAALQLLRAAREREHLGLGEEERE
jgi:DNA repair protein RecO (recombination protein O)